ncbi:MAG: ATP-binding protein [Geminicoccaceae bacterium]
MQLGVVMLSALEPLLDCSQSAIAILDTEGRVVLVNQAWRAFGTANGQRDPAFCVDRNYLDVCRAAMGMGAEGARTVADGLQSVAAGGPAFMFEYSCHSLTEQRWFVLRAKRIEFEARYWVVVLHEDTSARKRAEARSEHSLHAAETRRKENDLFRAVIDTLPDFIFAKDRAGQFLVANRATAQLMQAQSPDELIGRTDADFYPADIAAGFKADEEAFLAAGETVIIEQPGRRIDGSRGWLCSLKTPLLDENGHITGYVGHGRDITDAKLRDQALADAVAQLERQAVEMRRLTAAAERANQAKSQFLAAMSHEIRTPMTGVLGMADLLAAEGLSPAQQRHVDTIRASGRYLLNILNDILDFSRIEAGRIDLERIDFALQDVIEQVSSMMTPQALDRGLELRLETSIAPLLVVRGDPTRLRQVLVNLIGNALKFSPSGTVTLRVRELGPLEHGPRLRFEVADSGIGIPHERQAELFQPFVQAESSTARNYGGTGLGLVICRSLVNAMGGVIGLESQPGQGSLFWFEVPLETGDGQASAAGSASAPEAIAPLRILVVDDVPVNRELLQAMLGRYGHDVVVAENGAAAVEMAGRGDLDVVLMDVQMPVMNGIEATRHIRRLAPPAGAVPILALTANVMVTERERYLAAGMNLCLTKPIIWPELFAVLAGIASGKLASVSPSVEALPRTEAPKPCPMKVPLVDHRMLTTMAASLPPGACRTLLTRGLEGARLSWERLGTSIESPEVMLHEAHRLRGTAGSFGLIGISALAGRIEESMARGDDVAVLIDTLGEVIKRTVAEADDLDLDPSSPAAVAGRQ